MAKKRKPILTYREKAVLKARRAGRTWRELAEQWHTTIGRLRNLEKRAKAKEARNE